MRIGVIHQVNGLGTGAAEQLLGVRLAARHTREESHIAPKLELVERPFVDDAQLPQRLDELLGNADCDALLGILPVPLSVQAAASCEARGILYATGNNNTCGFKFLSFASFNYPIVFIFFYFLNSIA